MTTLSKSEKPQKKSKTPLTKGRRGDIIYKLSPRVAEKKLEGTGKTVLEN